MYVSGVGDEGKVGRIALWDAAASNAPAPPNSGQQPTIAIIYIQRRNINKTSGAAKDRCDIRDATYEMRPAQVCDNSNYLYIQLLLQISTRDPARQQCLPKHAFAGAANKAAAVSATLGSYEFICDFDQ